MVFSQLYVNFIYGYAVKCLSTALSANALLAIVSLIEMHIKTPCILHMNQATAALSLRDSLKLR